jgi:hypothetical protein
MMMMLIYQVRCQEMWVNKGIYRLANWRIIIIIIIIINMLEIAARIYRETI